jgi:hypothetical protein
MSIQTASLLFRLCCWELTSEFTQCGDVHVITRSLNDHCYSSGTSYFCGLSLVLVVLVLIVCQGSQAWGYTENSFRGVADWLTHRQIVGSSHQHWWTTVKEAKQRHSSWYSWTAAKRANFFFSGKQTNIWLTRLSRAASHCLAPGCISEDFSLPYPMMHSGCVRTWLRLGAYPTV